MGKWEKLGISEQVSQLAASQVYSHGEIQRI